MSSYEDSNTASSAYSEYDLTLTPESFSELLVKMKVEKEKYDGFETSKEEFDDYFKSYLQWKKENPDLFEAAFTELFLANMKRK